MKDPLIILSPPRSFSSVISTVIGEHPELYCFPELHLFVGDTIREFIDYEYEMFHRISGSDGILRTLAQIHEEVQTTATVLRAANWLSERQEWSVKKMMDYLLEKVDPLIGVEKSPITSRKPLFMERAYALYPNAFYLHLTRHPLPSRKSMLEFYDDIRARKGDTDKKFKIDFLLGWYRAHQEIVNFTNTLPIGQNMRVRGEDIISEPDVYLPQIAEWLGIRTDREAIEMMKHPETSPYAYVGPKPAQGGNDGKFMRNPVLRAGKVREPSITDFFEKESIDWFSDDFIQALNEHELEPASHQQISEQIMNLSRYLGYN